MCAVLISEQTAIFALHNLNWLFFTMEMKSVYWALGTGVLNETVYVLPEGEFVMYCIYMVDRVAQSV